MFVALRDSGGGQQGLSPELQSALAAGYAVVRARRLPSTSTTQGANFSGSLHKFFYFQFALRSPFAQVITAAALCTSCEGKHLLVENPGETLFHRRDTESQKNAIRLFVLFDRRPSEPLLRNQPSLWLGVSVVNRFSTSSAGRALPAEGVPNPASGADFHS